MDNDLIPEEESLEYRKLLTSLRTSSQQHAPISNEEQMQIVMRVRERFVQATSTSTLDERGEFILQPLSMPYRPIKPASKVPRFAANLLAALVVIGLVISTWVLLVQFSPHQTVAKRPSIAETGPIVRTTANGLQASLHLVTPGPYFLKELVPIELSLTNQTSQTVTGDGPNSDYGCGSALTASITAGSPPLYSFPDPGTACFAILYATHIAPGQTLTIRSYLPLTKSGAVTITMGGMGSPYATFPVDGHWPSVHIQVDAQVPARQMITLQAQGDQVLILAPPAAQAHLLAEEAFSCTGPGGHGGLGEGSYWHPLAHPILSRPACSGPGPYQFFWRYVVSAPGYVIVSGAQIT